MTGIERIEGAFSGNESIKLMAHAVVGYPDMETSERILAAMVEAGADGLDLDTVGAAGDADFLATAQDEIDRIDRLLTNMLMLSKPADVVVVSAGGRPDSASFQLARHSGAVCRIVHLHDPTFDKADFFTLGIVLAEAARRLGARVVFTGEHSDSEGQGMVPAALAHHLRAPLFARVADVQLPETGDEVLRLTVRSGGRLAAVKTSTANQN